MTLHIGEVKNAKSVVLDLKLVMVKYKVMRAIVLIHLMGLVILFYKYWTVWRLKMSIWKKLWAS